MRLVEQHVIARRDGRYRLIDAAAFASKNLRNVASSLGHAHHLQAGTLLEAPDGILSLEDILTPRTVREEHGPLLLDLALWLMLCQREDSPAAIDEVVE